MKKSRIYFGARMKKILSKIFNVTAKKNEDVRSNRSIKLKGFIEISTKTGQNVQKAFEVLTRSILKKGKCKY